MSSGEISGPAVSVETGVVLVSSMSIFGVIEGDGVVDVARFCVAVFGVVVFGAVVVGVAGVEEVGATALFPTWI
ncbi:hypothetical protein ABZX92_45940 [Lentzea sp. NPDC006480]|uniref:hypothetical protein n=1 Tax=Lentzea sp. NPDC006480 TaxID=3157176 RepID=UPI0033A49812